jgi:hypothetical protein
MPISALASDNADFCHHLRGQPPGADVHAVDRRLNDASLPGGEEFCPKWVEFQQRLAHLVFGQSFIFCRFVDSQNLLSVDLQLGEDSLPELVSCLGLVLELIQPKSACGRVPENIMLSVTVLTESQ